MSDRATFTQHVADYLRARPHTWIDGVVFETVGGRYAWRSRISDCRVELGMTIENRRRRCVDSEGQPFTISEYRYTPPVATTSGHDLNAWRLR